MKTKKLLLLLILPFLLSGCLGINEDKANSPGNYGGIFRSDNLGGTWEHITKLYTVGGQEMNFSATNITNMSFDPLDDSAIYIGTQNNGLFFSYNYGDGWFNVLQDKGVVNDIAIDPRNNCTIFVAVHKSIYKSIDCARTWKEIYFETRADQYITALAVNGTDNRIVYAATAGGTFLKSHDYGLSWDVIKRFDKYIQDILIQNHLNSDYLYVVTKADGIFKTTDGGSTWFNLMDLKVDQAELEEDQFKTLKEIGSNTTMAINVDRSVPDGIIYINKLGIFRLTDNNLWQQIKLLTPKGKEVIYSVVVNPANGQEIIYGTSQALYHSIDNGNNWAISKLPTTNSARILNFSPDNSYLYLGSFKILDN